MGDRIVVMKDGEIQQVADPITLYERPANQFVGSFIGSPAMSFLGGELGQGEVRGQGFDLRLSPRLAQALAARGAQPVSLGLRPEAVGVRGHSAIAEDGNVVGARVEVVEPLGAETLLTVQIGEAPIVVRAGGHLRPRAGDAIELVVDADRLHVFDPRTELNIGLH